jgi:hypothetical protein
MISNTNPTSTDTAALFQQLFKRADYNQDGQVSIDEFTKFLSSVLSQTPASGTATPSPAPTPGTPATYTDRIPGQTTSASALAGWDQTKWNDVSHESPKYRIGRILASAPPTTDSLSSLMPELQFWYPGLQQTGKDTINVPGYGTFDVIHDVGGPEASWQFLQVLDANGQPIS